MAIQQNESKARPTILALDLEGTLISNAASQIPRPGLFPFLEWCRGAFARIVMFTTVDEARFRKIAALLVDEGLAPPWFSQLEYVPWTGGVKDLAFVADAHVQDVLLVDDHVGYVHPDQMSQWVEVECFSYPYSDQDAGLEHVLGRLTLRLGR